MSRKNYEHVMEKEIKNSCIDHDVKGDSYKEYIKKISRTTKYGMVFFNLLIVIYLGIILVLVKEGSTGYNLKQIYIVGFDFILYGNMILFFIYAYLNYKLVNIKFSDNIIYIIFLINVMLIFYFSVPIVTGSDIYYVFSTFTGKFLNVLVANIILFGTYFYWGIKLETEQLERARKEKKEQIAETFASEISNGETEYFNKIVQINLSNLADYYAMVKSHTDRSFQASMLSGLLGFLLIVIGIIIGYFDKNGSTTLTYIATFSGIMIEFISGTFFYLYNRTVRQLKEYHDSLLDVQNILLSFKVVSELKDSEERNKMIAQMVNYLFTKRV